MIKPVKKLLSAVIVPAMAVAMTACSGSNALLLHSVDYYEDGSMRADTTYTYDKQGHVTERIEEVHYSEDDITTRKTVNHYAGDLLVTADVYYLEDGAWEPSFSHAYGYNEDGNETASIGFSNEDGVKMLFAVDLTEYDTQGRKVSCSSYMNDEAAGSLTVFMRTEYTYDDQGRMAEASFYDDMDMDGFIDYDCCDRYTYNEDGTVKEIAEYDAENVPTSITRYTYDDKQHELSEEIASYGADGSEQIYYRLVNEYDKKGNLIKDTSYSLDDTTGELKQSSNTVYEY